ncbi:MAG: galactose ABC transporter substrate-binding protein [Clostridia bacterium]|nr:galactose ABC transporter substrate-binding protein [Clostridia bacterium]
MLVSFAGCAKTVDTLEDNTDDDFKNLKGEISVLYYSYSDTYISSVRTALDAELNDKGVKFTNYDANSNQTTQSEQVQTALAKGSSMLIVNLVETGSTDLAENIVSLARERNIPVIFFNRSVEESVVKSYDKCVFVGTDSDMSGHMQGKMIGNYVLENYDKIDLNGDGKISYVLFKGQEGNTEANARTKYAVEDCNKILTAAGKSEIEFYDSVNANKYLVDQDGNWSASAATNYMGTILAQYSEANGNMIELVIANNDEMALGAISSLQQAGYNKQGGKYIPVFGIDATDAAKSKIADGSMTGTIKQDAEGMADAIVEIAENFVNGADIFEDIPDKNIVDGWKVNIPYEEYRQ